MARRPTSTCAIEVDLAQLLWLTRARQLPFARLLQPEWTIDGSWEALPWRIFAGLTPEARPQHIAGTITHRGAASAYLATLFLDPVRVGSDGRPVAHYLVWFPPAEHAARLVTPADWGPQLVLRLGLAYDTVVNVVLYGEGHASTAERVRTLFTREVALTARSLHLEGEAAMVVVQPALVTWRDPLPGEPSEGWYDLVRALVVWAATFALLALVVYLIRRST